MLERFNACSKRTVLLNKTDMYLICMDESANTFLAVAGVTIACAAMSVKELGKEEAAYLGISCDGCKDANGSNRDRLSYLR